VGATVNSFSTSRSTGLRSLRPPSPFVQAVDEQNTVEAIGGRYEEGTHCRVPRAATLGGFAKRVRLARTRIAKQNDRGRFVAGREKPLLRLSIPHWIFFDFTNGGTHGSWITFGP
jgi:hypothetical protein